MADIKLQVTPTQDMADQLRSAGAAMHSAMEDAASILNNASGEMSGVLQGDSTALYQLLQNSNSSMTSDVNSAASTLDEMISLLQTADQRGAAAFGS
jgi:hypothetical protein